MGIEFKEAKKQIRSLIRGKIFDGLTTEEAVYATKRELAQMKEPAEAYGNVKKAVDSIMTECNCSSDLAFVKLKNFVNRHDWVGDGN